MVAAGSVASALAVCFDPPRRTYSANRVNVSWLYLAPHAADGSTKGVRPVLQKNGSNQPSAEIVRF
eukprot:5918911-Pleurochrysis_carterae.AAC.1